MTSDDVTQDVVTEIISNGMAPHMVTSWEIASHEMTS